MTAILHQRQWRLHASNATLFALAMAVAGCSSIGSSSSSSTDTGIAARPSIADFFTNSSAKGVQQVSGAQPDTNCPTLDVRDGAATLAIGSGNGNVTAMTLRYQGTFNRFSRDCAMAGANMVMRIGVQGRIIVGPTGGPGQVDVPIRFAVVQETPGGMRPITTKLVRLAVTIPPGSGNVEFTHIEDNIAFPLPMPISQLDDYKAYLGFDPQNAEPEVPVRPKPKPRRKPAAAAAND
jgi:hypothetical protein